MTSRRAQYLRLAIVATVVIAIDQVTKSLALASFEEQPADVIDGILTFRITYNSGGAFGLLQGLPGLFLVATLVATVVILFWVRNLDRPAWMLPLGMVLGGGVGNLIDRTVRSTDGQVVDFIDFHVWPVFNLADACIVVGVLWLVFLGGREEVERMAQ
ncbi:MAG: signal peptidase II [Actinomycetota bacterium]